MATVQKSRYVTIDDGQVTINNFVTKDKHIYAYFDKDASEDLDKRLEDALKVGIVAANTIETTTNVDYVEKEFYKLISSFQVGLDGAFGDNGKFAELLKGHFGEDGKLLEEYLNPEKVGSPLNIVLVAFKDKLEELKIALNVDQATVKALSTTTKKGTPFEDKCELFLQEIAQMHKDEIENSSLQTGQTAGAKKGDILHKINELDKIIIWEAKAYDEGTLTEPAIIRYLDKSIANRNADYGILITKNVNRLKKTIGWFKELSDNKLVIAVGDDDNESDVQKEILHIAYGWARARLLHNSTKNTKFNASDVQDKIANVQRHLNEITNIKTKCTSIESTSTQIKDIADSIRNEINKEVNQILEMLIAK